MFACECVNLSIATDAQDHPHFYTAGVLVTLKALLFLLSLTSPTGEPHNLDQIQLEPT